ncbi:glycosyltransferase family 2 protein [Mucilaginibacter sp. KACC 22063]|uniref:glycosyltransferase family 2 protein n=1 Tax=Mucilaginibacter sp. KACC 22063 TaxID=3025666 RepID=UPI002365577B|nr:glycosyltransferase family 2 protein [Mucilaginibacter sp. KACC 22063]WDF54455.1 glycosyltransferase family 2 protein [Mucilaginibacter sp. KACC 22063]
MIAIAKNVLQALILTKNEEPNIGRVLDKLKWLERVVVIDSYSDDNTVKIMESYPNVEIIYRKFDTFAQQCNFGLTHITSEWVLSLDADYVLPDDFIAETGQLLNNGGDFVAYNSRFEFLIYGKKLLSNNTTPRPVLFKTKLGSYFDDGHAHRLSITGSIGDFKSKIWHDDRKSLTRWLNNQNGYSVRECDKLLDLNNADRNSIINKLRRTKVLAPFFVFFYCLFVKGLIFNGWAGWYYTLQRTVVEMLFALRLIEAEEFNIVNH